MENLPLCSETSGEKHSVARAQLLCADVLVAFLETAGYYLEKMFGRQFVKLIRTLSQSLLPELPEETPAATAAKRRLTVLLLPLQSQQQDSQMKTQILLSRMPEAILLDKTNHLL